METFLKDGVPTYKIKNKIRFKIRKNILKFMIKIEFFL